MFVEEPKKLLTETQPTDTPDSDTLKAKSKKKKLRKERKLKELTATASSREDEALVVRGSDTQDENERLHGAGETGTGDEEDAGVTTKEHKKSKKRKQQPDTQVRR